MTIDDLSPSEVRSFLEYVEKERGCGGATCNLRLATIHSLAKFIGVHSPEHVAWCAQIRTMPFKKTIQSTLTYLDKPEVDALLATPDQHTPAGRRDHALLLFLYNTGARVSEAAHLTVGDIRWVSSAAVHLVGKGRKARILEVVDERGAPIHRGAAGHPITTRVLLQPAREYCRHRA